MKNQFVILGFVLIYLIPISIAGCSEKISTESPESTLMEQLTGEYVLVEFKGSVDGFTLSVEPPNVFGELVLETGGRYFSLTMVITDGVSLIDGNEKTLYDTWKAYGDSWGVDETSLKIKEHNRTEYSGFEYTWDEKHLTLDHSENDVTLTTKWQKL